MKHNKLLIASLTALLLTGSMNPLITQAADMNKYADGAFVKKHWAYNDINYAMDNGWLNGKKDGNSVKIDVNGIITRAEYLKMLLDIVDPGLEKYGRLNLAEELSDYVVVGGLPGWYSEYANAYINLVGGYNGNTAEDWNTPISRNDMASMLYSLTMEFRPDLLDPTKNNIDNLISDRNSKDYNGLVGWNAIESLYSNGIMTGKENNAFKPYDNATRGEACAVLRRLADRNARLKIDANALNDKAEDRYDYTEGENATLKQSDPYRRSVKEGDTFIDANGKEWKVKINPITGTYNPTEPVGFDLGRENSLGRTNAVTSDSDGTAGGKLGDILVQAPNGHINWTSEFEKIYASGFDKPTKPGTKEGQLSEHKYYIWDAMFNEWAPNISFMYAY